MLPPEVENVISHIASSINEGQAIVFCGAGISRDSGFPIVNEFVPYVLLTLCTSPREICAIEAFLKTITDTQQRQDRLKQIISEKMAVSLEVVDKIVNSLPFEVFIETLRNDSKIDEILDIYNVEAYQPHVEPNSNHMMLARLVAAGKVRTIITTNFDQLIEKALERQGKHAGLDYDVIYREKDFASINWAQERVRLIKIHGSVDDKQAIAITLSQVARQELSTPRADVIRYVFSQGAHKTVLILGYSCSDVFDLSWQIETLTENLKQVYLVQHSGRLKIQDIREQEQKNPFKSFSGSIRLFIDTRDLVGILWKAILKEPYEDHKTFKTIPDWNAKVRAWYEDSVQIGSDYTSDIFCGRIVLVICEWRTAIKRYEHMIANIKGHLNDRLKGPALNNLGLAYLNLGEYRKAIEIYEEALEVFRRFGNVQGEGNALANMGMVYLGLGEYHKAIEFSEQALEIHRRIGDSWGEANDLGNIGRIYEQLGEYGKSMGLQKQQLEISRHIGDVQGEGNALGNIGMDYIGLSEYHKAIEVSEQALEIHRRIGYIRGEGNSLNNLGLAYVGLSEYRKAIEVYEQALEIFRRIEDIPDEGNSLSNLGMAYAGLSEYRKAIEVYEQALEIHQCIEDSRGEGIDLGNISRAYTHLGQFAKAIVIAEQALDIHRRIGDVRCEAADLGNMGLAYLNNAGYPKAIALFDQHIKIARSIGDTRGEATDLGNIGLAYALMGNKEKAVKAFAQSKAIFAKQGLLSMASSVEKMSKRVGL